MSIKAALLPGRSLIEAAGEDRVSFLQGLITNNAERLADGAARFAGLLSPQGKILFDFLVMNTGETLLLDCPQPAAAGLLSRLGFYKLRAKVSLADVTARWCVAAAWGEDAAKVFAGKSQFAFPDPRLPALGYRALLSKSESAGFASSPAGYEALRVAAAVPEGGKDYSYGDAFPHEACFDFLGGIDFKKGCYVGQEVVSRMEHRGTARTRILAVNSGQPLPDGGADILAEGFAVGRLGSVSGHRGIALARLDRVSDALAKGQPLTAGTVPVELTVPVWAGYRLDSVTKEPAH